MQPDLVADQSLALPLGVVRLTIARHVDGHYSGVATLRRTGRRIGLLVSDRPAAGCARVRRARVDPCVADTELLAALTELFRETALAEAVSRDAGMLVHGQRVDRLSSVSARWTAGCGEDG